MIHEDVDVSVRHKHREAVILIVAVVRQVQQGASDTKGEDIGAVGTRALTMSSSATYCTRLGALRKFKSSNGSHRLFSSSSLWYERLATCFDPLLRAWPSVRLTRVSLSMARRQAMVVEGDWMVSTSHAVLRFFFFRGVSGKSSSSSALAPLDTGWCPS